MIMEQEGELRGGHGNILAVVNNPQDSRAPDTVQPCWPSLRAAAQLLSAVHTFFQFI